MEILNGLVVSKALRETFKSRVQTFQNKMGYPPGLSVILVGDDPASHVYVKNKDKACQEVGISSIRINLPKETSEAELKKVIEEQNENPQVHGILVQLPLPQHISVSEVLRTIDPKKDADGLTYENMGLLWAGFPRVRSCTPYGVMKILEYYKISVVGLHAVVVGKSNIVGKPMAQMLLSAGATVTVCHRGTQNLREHTSRADLVVVAAGQKRFLGKDDFKKDSIVVDVGMHRLDGGKLCGDVRLEELENWAKAATPVPKGVGPMTITMLLENTLTLAGA